jgi:hypothetical protein
MRKTLPELARNASIAALITLVAACALDAEETGDPSSAALEVAGDEVQTSSAPAVPVYFNHSFDMVSLATTDALQNNAYLKNEFVDVELRTTVRPDLTYTATYLNMRETYLEFFPVGTFGYPLGAYGIALGDEVTGGMDWIIGQWQAEFGDDQAQQSLISREVNGVTLPWFQIGTLDWANASEYTSFWAMQYVPDAGSTAPRTRLTERATRYQPSKLARDVDAILYGIPEVDRDNLVRSLRAVGWRIIDLGGNRFIALSAVDGGKPRAFIGVPAEPGRAGMLALLIRLNRFARHREQLGDAVLDVGVGGLPYAILWIMPPTSGQAALLQAQAR